MGRGLIKHDADFNMSCISIMRRLRNTVDILAKIASLYKEVKSIWFRAHYSDCPIRHNADESLTRWSQSCPTWNREYVLLLRQIRSKLSFYCMHSVRVCPVTFIPVTWVACLLKASLFTWKSKTDDVVYVLRGRERGHRQVHFERLIFIQWIVSDMKRHTCLLT